MNFKPSIVRITESVPGSVASFKITAQLEGSGAVLREATYPRPAGPGPTFDIPVGSNGFFQPGDEGHSVVFHIQEIGADGTLGPDQGEMNDDGVGNKVHGVFALPDGAESFTVID